MSNRGLVQSVVAEFAWRYKPGTSRILSSTNQSAAMLGVLVTISIDNND